MEQNEQHSKRFRLLANASPVMIWMTDIHGHTDWFNVRWLEFVGCSLEEELAHGWQRHLHPDDHAWCDALYCAAEAERTRYQLEYRLRRHDGEYRWIQDTGSPYFEVDGGFGGYIGLCLDITEKKFATEENTRLLAETQKLVLQQRAFLKDVLFAVTEGHLNLCDSAADLPAEIGSSEVRPFHSSADLWPIREMVREVAEKCGVTGERLYDLLIAIGEAAMNAVRHAGGGVCRVSTDADRTLLQVRIQDWGAGIAIDSLHRAVLERGFTTTGTFGHGFFLMLRTADRIFLLTGEQGTTVVIEQGRIEPEPEWLNSFANEKKPV